MKHTMGLQPIPFDLIRNGDKTIELRLYDEKRQKIRVGDTIEFTYENKKILTTVIGFVFADSFKNLFQIVSPIDCGFTTAPQGVKIMKMFYPLSRQRTLGVVGIKIKKIK